MLQTLNVTLGGLRYLGRSEGGGLDGRHNGEAICWLRATNFR